MSIRLLAQMDVGPMMPGLCTAIGCVIIPASVLTWWLCIRRKSRTTMMIIFAISTSLFLIFWLVALVDLRHEPSIDDTGAVMAVWKLAEVQQFVKEGPSGFPPSRAAEISGGAGGTMMGHEWNWNVTVAEFDQNRHPKAVWNTFHVNAVTGAIHVFVKNQWISLDE